MAKVLVVDDSAVDRRLVGGLLSKINDVTVEFATSGVEALQHVREQAPNLVVTDLIMPKMDGFTLVASLVNEFPMIPVILMTGKGSEEIAVKALKEGAASYVPKPMLTSLLVETVENILAVAQEKQQQIQLMDCLKSSNCTFELGNNSAMIPHLINYVHQGIRSVGLCDESSGIRVSVALEEALNNALFHGNLEISSDLRERDRAEYRRLIEERMRTSPFSDRKIYVTVHLSRDVGRFVIRDEGPGFDPDALPDPTDPENLEKASGRGILLMRTFMDELQFNEVGNEVRMTKRAGTNGGIGDSRDT
jgi:CheY-like chemotaxis protein/anti-sigma regulatory factor (Ser/Thr protein kinase)